MNVPRIFLMAGGLCTATITGCVLDVEDHDHLDPMPPVERAGVLETVCDRAVHIARRDADTDCPSMGQWVGEQLFDIGSKWLTTSDHAPVPGALAHFCRYTWDDDVAPTPEQRMGLYNAEGIDSISPSCQAVSGQSDVLTDTFGLQMRTIFHANTGRPSSIDLGLPDTGTTEPNVTMLVVDSQSGNLQISATSKHGRHMGNIISDIACPDDDPTCRVDVRYVVGLPRLGNGTANYVNGGWVGTRADIAAAIYEGVRRWEEGNATLEVPTRLVMNFSLGWEGMLFGGLEDEMPASVEAVRTALEFAACHGALLIASTGNKGDFCGMTGPLLPAAWESRPAPDAARCAELGFPEPPLDDGAYRPLVHAVGGLDLDLGPMPGSRTGATPRLMAASSHVVAGEPLHGGLTGTSLAAAVTSAAAALVWSYQPELEAGEVMDLVYAGGIPLADHTTDFALADTTPAAPHRVDACQALHTACTAPEATCPPMPLSCLETEPISTTELSMDFTALEPDVTLESSLPEIDSSCVDACGEPVEIRVAAGTTANCAAFAVDPTEHLVNPTPDSIACPTCGLRDGVLSLSIHSDFDNETIDNVMVHLVDEAGVDYHYDLGTLTLSSTEYTTVTLPVDELPVGDIREGHITIDSTAPTTTDPLLVLEASSP